MNNAKIKKAIVMVGLLTGICTARALPLQHTDLPAAPAWLLHLDCDALRLTVLGQYVLAEMEKPEAKAKLEVFQSLFTFDPRKQLHGVTLYSTGKTPEDGVLLLYADFDTSRLETLAKAAKQYKSSTHTQHTIHSWLDDKRRSKDGDKARNYAAIHGGRVVVFGQREGRVAEALDVLDRAVPLLSATDPLVQFGDGDNASFLVGAARKLDFANSDPNAAILKLSKMCRVQLAETQRQLTARVNLETNDEDVAQNIISIGQGLISLVKLQKEKPETLKLAESLTLKQQGANVRLQLGLPADEVVGWLKSKNRKHAEKTEK